MEQLQIGRSSVLHQLEQLLYVRQEKEAIYKKVVQGRKDPFRNDQSHQQRRFGPLRKRLAHGFIARWLRQ